MDNILCNCLDNIRYTNIISAVDIAEEPGFLGIMGLLDCMHWMWKNCTIAHQGHYTGKEKEPTIMLEAVASYDLWIWHAYFGLSSLLNNINMLDQSPVFQHIQDGNGHQSRFW